MWSTCRRSSSELAGYYIPRRTLRHFFLPSAPRQPHRHFHQEVCKTRQVYIDVGIFISRCFLCSDIILCLGIFTRKLGGKTRNLGGKSGIWQNFCSKHFSALNNVTRPYKNLSASAFFGPRHLFWESAEINAHLQVRHFFLPRGVCRYLDECFCGRSKTCNYPLQSNHEIY